MNRSELRAIRGRLTRVHRNLHGIHQAAQQALDELAVLSGLVDEQLDRSTNEAERAPRTGRTKTDYPEDLLRSMNDRLVTLERLTVKR